MLAHLLRPWGFCSPPLLIRSTGMNQVCKSHLKLSLGAESYLLTSCWHPLTSAQTRKEMENLLSRCRRSIQYKGPSFVAGLFRAHVDVLAHATRRRPQAPSNLSPQREAPTTTLFYPRPLVVKILKRRKPNPQLLNSSRSRSRSLWRQKSAPSPPAVCRLAAAVSQSRGAPA